MMTRSCYSFVHILSLSLIVACGVCHAKTEGAIKLMVVDAATDTDLHLLRNGDNLDVSKLGSSLTLRANPSVRGDQSVVFVLDGKHYQTENLAPYAMAGGSRTNYKAWDLDLGTHILAVNVYNRARGQGKRIASRRVSFSLVDGKAAVEVDDMAASEFGGKVARKAGGEGGGIELMVVDAAKDTDLRPLRNGDALDVSKLGSSLTLRANPSVKGHKSVVFALDGKHYQTENLAPYAMAGGSRTNYKAWDLDLGTHILAVNVYNRAGGKGKRIASRRVSFSLVEVGRAGGKKDGRKYDGDREGGSNEVACNLQQRIKRALPGDTINGAGCVERSAVKLHKRLTLKNLIVKGSDDWSGDFTAVGGNYRSIRTVPAFDEPSKTDDSNNLYLCETTDKHQLCGEAEMVFVDDMYLRQVPDGSDPEPGEFAMDGQRHVILGKNPGRAQVEVVVRQVGVHLYDGAAGTVLDNVLVTQIGNTVQGGTGAAVRNNRLAITIKNSTVSWVHGTGINCGGGSRCEITGTEVHHAGIAGVKSWKASPLIFDHNLIHHNCSSLPDVLYNDSFNCSGLKVMGASPKGQSVTNSEFHHNDHSGIWLDGHATNVLIANNRIHHNEERGIEVENSSGDTTIRDNVIYANGWVGTGSTASNSGGIYLLDAGNVKIYRNVMACNRDGFAFIDQHRPGPVTGNELYNNDIIVGGEDPGKQMLTYWLLRDDTLGSNIAHDNRYYYGGQQDNSHKRKFQWDRKTYASLAKFNSTPGENHSSWLSTAKVRSILSANNIPMDCL